MNMEDILDLRSTFASCLTPDTCSLRMVKWLLMVCIVCKAGEFAGQISHGANLLVLSDKIKFPSFLRTLPNSKMTSRAIVQLLMHFGWTWVGLVSMEKPAVQSTMQMMKEDFLQAGACIAFLEDLPVSFSRQRTLRAVQMMKMSSANAIVAIATEPYMVYLLDEMARQNVTGKVWIATHSWASSSLLSTVEFSVVLAGTIGFASRRGVIPGLADLLYTINPQKNPKDLFIQQFWEQAFSCKWPSTVANESLTAPHCTGSERLEDLNEHVLDVNNFRLTYNVYNAVYAAAHALQDLHSCQPGKGPFHNGACATLHNFKPWQLLHYLKKVRFANPIGDEVYFDENGDPPAVYDILNWQQIPDSVCSKPCLLGFRRASREGEAHCCYDCIPCSEEEISNPKDSAECSPCPYDQMPNERRDSCIPKPIEYLSYLEPLGEVLTTISLVGILFVIAIVIVFVTHNQTPLVKANNLALSYLLLVALGLCFACPLMFIGQPLSLNCMLRQVTFGIAFALCVSCVLAKTATVILAFRATKPYSLLQQLFGFKIPYCIVVTCPMIQLFICVSWFVVAPPFQQMNFRYSIKKVLNECNEGSTWAFWLMLGYMAFLATVTLAVAFLARKLPDSFNEAKLITFSMLVFVSVWVSFTPAYLSTRGKLMVSVEIFAILASTSGLLGCIFLPKCYIILLKPEMNSREHVMGRR
ncbi:vomeronasal type-2 receptor 1-like [Ambystoma mexicanum]|uniref:vomeronasal type-2 receptor 1-like n=1 Tax=Ambystoma mexicanum TaxID=8296 RepID=UPI0037E8632D